MAEDNSIIEDRSGLDGGSAMVQVQDRTEMLPTNGDR